MSRYRKIEVSMWGDAKFKRLSKLQPSGQALWVFLLTCPETSIIPGLFGAGRAGLAESVRWSQEDFDRCFEEIENLGMAKADFANRLVWIPNAVRYNPPANPNVVTSWWKEYAVLPECELKSAAGRAICQDLQRIGASFRRAFASAKTVRQPVTQRGPIASRKPSTKPSQKGLSNQEQKKQQGQEKKEQQGQENADPPLLLPQGGGTGGLKKQSRQIAERVAKESSFVARHVLHVLTDVAQQELEAGGESESIANRMIDAWRRYQLRTEELKFQWGPANFFGEGHWKNPKAWPWDVQRAELAAAARVGTFTPP